jgi:fatty acid hydroxylase domain-containing protein 2
MEFIYQMLTYYIVFILSFWIPTLILFFVDMKNIFFDYKIQNKSPHSVISSYSKCYPTVLFNTLIAVLPFISLMTYITMNNPYSFGKTFIDLLISLPLVDFFFYIFHRLFRLPQLYGLFHKKHHEVTAPIGMSALYMTIVDLCIGNIIPVYLPMIILSASPYTISLWMALTTVNTVIMAHSGFIWLADFHDYHHKVFIRNYGTNIFMDWLLITRY